MSYGDLEKEFINVVNHCPPFDFSKLEKILEAGADINAEGEWGNILEDTLPELGDNMWIDENTRGNDHDILDYIKFCLSHGFDARRDHGAAGAKAIWSMVYNNPCGDLLLEAIRLFLDAGADPSYCSDEDGDSLAGCYAADAFMAIFDDDPYTGEMYYTAWALLNQAALGRDTKDIRFYSDALGRRIEDIFIWDAGNRSLDESGKEKLGSVGYSPSNYLSGGLAMICDGLPLCATPGCDLMINPYAFAGKKTRKISDLNSLIGKMIADINFKANHYHFGKTGTESVDAKITFSDGMILNIKDLCLYSPEVSYLIYQLI